MSRIFAIGWAAALILLCCVSAAQQSRDSGEKRYRYANRPDALYPYARVRVYKDAFSVAPEFLGAGREYPDPEVRSVRLGLIAPLAASARPRLEPGTQPVAASASKTLFGRHLLQGALLALKEANAEGGYRGRPFELVRRTDLVLWGQTSNELVKFAYDDKVWAILSGIDSNHSHVLNRAALKAEMPIVNAGSTDPTLTEHTIPWLIRCINDDRLHSYELLNYIYRVKGFTRVALLRVNDRDGRVGVMEFVNGARRLGHPVLLELRFDNGDTDFSQQLDRIHKLGAEALVLWANPPEGAAIVRQVREMNLQQALFGFDRLSHPLFLELAQDAADGLVVASSYNPDSPEPRSADFRRRYREEFGEGPDAYATHAYDGMRILVWAVRRAGLNRARIRDALYSLDSFAGASGEIVFDPTMNDVGRAWLARVGQGRFEFFQPEDWERNLDLRVIVPSRSALQRKP